MGFQIKYLLVDGPLLPVCDLLGLEDKGTRATGADATGVMLPSGFCLIQVDVRSRLLENGTKRISMTYPVIYGYLHENVSISSAERWENGIQVWKVEHDSFSNGYRHLEFSGALPEIFEEVKSHMFSEQDEEDKLENDGCDMIFEIPVELIKRLTGYHYSKCLPDEMVHCLVRRETPKEAG